MTRGTQSATALKLCSICHELKPRAYFYIRRGKGDGLRAKCKICHEARRAELRLDPIRKQREHDQHAAASKKYSARLWIERGKDPVFLLQKQKIDKASYQRRKHTITAKNRAAYTLNPESFLGPNREWIANHPHIKRIGWQTRRARVKSNGGTFTETQWLELCARSGNRCLACGLAGTPKTLSVDHVLPLCHGGTNDISNIQPLCISCNSKKGPHFIDYRTMEVFT